MDKINYHSPQVVVGIFALVLKIPFYLEESHQYHRPAVQLPLNSPGTLGFEVE